MKTPDGRPHSPRKLDTPERHCLIVDDEPHLREILLRILRGEGFSCDEAATGRDAIQALTTRTATLVLCDLLTPEVDEVDLLRHVRRHYPDTAVIVVTSAADVRLAVECLSLGALDYVTKPFHLDDVRARVRQALDKRRLIRENIAHAARLEERVRAETQRLETHVLAAVQSIAETLEAKDPYAQGHSLRVSRSSAIMAHALGMPGSFTRQIALGGAVHDIGKVGVREAVLNKPGPLTDREYEHVMAHPETGWRILSPVLAGHPVALNAVRHHHERWDGRGLPGGLAADEIPLEARIVAVTNTFDAMISRRAYRPGVSVDAAVAELKRCKASRFDPRMVDVFSALLARAEIDAGTWLPSGE
ncbi:MAG TPA: HD domain-containing phosphohydrolase [Gemmatimonadaceae bacterium]|nr:HD domain-containing phosphohydrolase [Gemmatimonadaceae bacterium]